MTFQKTHHAILMFVFTCLFKLADLQLSEARFKRIALTGVVFSDAAVDVVSGTKRRCAVRCTSSAQCLSFSFHETSGRCLEYHYRVFYGHKMSAADGFVHYWRKTDNCPTSFHLTAGVCVKVANDRINWYDAQNTCEAYGGHLYVGETADQMSALASAIAALGTTSLDYRVGATMDPDHPGTWKWITGTRVKDALWRDGKARNESDQKCAETTLRQPDKLFSDRCSESDRYVCQIPLGG